MAQEIDTTRAVRMHQAGAAEVLALEPVPMPMPEEGQVRIEVHAAGINYPDLLLRTGRLPVRAFPFTPGADVVGVVNAVGPGAQTSAIHAGARVVALIAEGSGGYAEHVVVPASTVTVLPARVAFEEAIALPISGLTALLALRLAGRLALGDSVFVPAAAGGVGTLAVQLARRLGARVVVGGASTHDRRKLARDLGADAVVDYTRPSWVDDLQAATGGAGADIVLQTGGNAMFEQSLRALAQGGRLVVFGAEDALSPSALEAAQMQALLRRGQTITGFRLTGVPEAVRRAGLAGFVDLVAARSLRVVTDRFPLAEAARAHAAMEARATRGKVILVTERGEAAGSTPRAALAKFVAAMEALSADALADLFSTEAVYEFPFLNPNRPERYDGRDAIRAGFRAVWIPDRVRIDRVQMTAYDTSDPEVVIGECELDATLLATGAPFTSRAVLFLRARGGQIVHLRDYTDALRVARGMGRVRELASALEGQA